MFLIGAVLFSLPALGDTGGSVSASLVITGSPEVAGGGGAADCVPLCPPPIPALYATKRWDLVDDHNGNALVDAGDTIRYRMLITNFAPVTMHGIDYVDILDPHVRLIPESWSITRGTVTEHDLDGAEILSVYLASLDPDEVVILSFEARVSEALPDGVYGIRGQATLFADTTSPIVTDDPDTYRLQDATWTPIVHASLVPAGGGASIEDGAIEVLKEAQILPSPEVFRVVDADSEIEYRIRYRNPSAQPMDGVRLVDLLGPYTHVRSVLALEEETEVHRFGRMELLITTIEHLDPGESVELVYRAGLTAALSAEIAYTASRAMISSRGSDTLFTDDPATQLSDDPTCVLFPYRCGEELWTWEDWLDVVSSAPTGLWPLVMREKDSSDHLRWVLYGGDFFGDLSVDPSVRPPLWPEWSLAGLVEIPPEAADQGARLGYRLAQRDEPHVEGFLAREPFFMWAQLDMPLFGRVPATDAGELLQCEGFDRAFCDRPYLPILLHLDWSRNWDMLWLEDYLIVATVAEAEGQP